MRIDEILGFGKADVNDQIAYQTEKYLKPFLQKWQEVLVTQTQAGVDTNNPAIRQQLLAKLISKYASLRKQDVPEIKSMMLKGDLSDISYVKTIADRAIRSSLMKRAIGDTETPTTTAAATATATTVGTPTAGTPAATKTRTGGKVPGKLSQTPAAIRKRQNTAATRATAAGLSVQNPAAPSINIGGQTIKPSDPNYATIMKAMGKK
jgi:hypothetical protein